jgi:predicted TIM-barrel fold metal-dependent hydrolase
MMIADSQIHIWGAHSAARPWPDPKARAQKPYPFTEDVILREMNGAGVDRVVLVPPLWDGAKNDLAIAAVQHHPDRFAIMGRLPIDPPTPSDVLAHWKEQPGMLGLRYTFTNELTDSLTNGQADWLWPAAEKAGLPVMVLTPGLLRHFHPILERHPSLKIIFDHLALPTHGKKDDAAFEELPELIMLARHPNAAVKASALPCYSTESYPYSGLHDYVRRVFDAYGPQRMFWGSDLSRLPPTCSYRQMVTLFTEEFRWLTGKDRELVMGRALCDWIGWK